MADLVLTRRNELRNPSFEVENLGSPGTPLRYSRTTTLATYTWVDSPWGTGKAQRMVVTNSSTDCRITHGDRPTVAGGQTVTFLLRHTGPGSRIRMGVEFFDPSYRGGFYRAIDQQAIGDGWSRIQAVVPAGVTTVGAMVYTGGLSQAGDDHVTDDWLLVVNEAYDGPYFDGNSPRSVDSETGHSLTHAWEGAVGDSVSIQSVYAQEPRVTFPRSMRSGWRYFATRLNGDGTETLLDPDLPLEGVTVENVLSGHGSLEGTLEPVYSRLLGPDGQPLLQEYSTAIYAEADGDVRGGGILVNSGFDGPTWDIEAVGFTGYAIDMPYVGNGYKGIRVDPIDVVRTIWQHIQNQPGGDIALEFDPTTTGGEVSIGTELQQVEFDTQEGPVSFESGPYKLNWYTNHDLAGDIDDLAAETPFDYAERHYWDADGILRHHVDLGYPRLGKRRENLRFVYGVNIFDPTQIERDGTTYASGTLVLGAGEGASMIKSLREPPTRPGNRLRRVAVVVDDSIRSRKKAVKRADQENQWRRRIDDIESIIVRDHPNAPLGAVKLGDEIRLEGKREWVGVDMWVRVLAIAFQPENGNVAEYTVARTDKLTS